MNEAGVLLDPPSPQRHLQCIQREFGPHVVRDLPAHDHPRVHVQDERHVCAAGPRADIRHVRHPWLVGAGGSEVAVDQVRRAGRQRLGHGGPAALTADDALQAQLTHQPFDRAAGHIDAPAPQRAGDPAGAIGAARLGMDLLDQGHELLVPQPAGRLRPLLAGVVSRLGPAEHPAHGPDPEAAVFQAVDHLVGLVRGRSSSWAKSALAALRISFARLNSATSLRSCFSSSHSTLVSRSSRSPLSASAWRTQPRRASLWMPRSFATCAIGRPVVRTSRTARSRSSSGYLRGAGPARGSPSGQDHKPGFRDSTKPGAAHTVIWTASSMISRSSRHGPGAYLRALVTSSLTTNCTVLIARADTGSPCCACTDMRKLRAMSRASAISALPSKAADAAIGRSTSGSWPSFWAAVSTDPPHFRSVKQCPPQLPRKPLSDVCLS